MKKNFHSNASQIVWHKVEIRTFTSTLGTESSKITLEINSGSFTYQYDIYKDSNHLDLISIRDYLNSMLNKAKKEKMNVKISVKDREYLFVEFQGEQMQKYTGGLAKK